MPTIFVADRDAGFRKALAHALRQRGASVVTFTSGAELYARFLAERPELVLMDTDLDEMNGFQVFARLLHRLPDRPLPIVFLTDFGSSYVAQVTVERGARAYLPRSRPLDEIVRAVESAAGPFERRGARVHVVEDEVSGEVRGRRSFAGRPARRSWRAVRGRWLAPAVLVLVLGLGAAVAVLTSRGPGDGSVSIPGSTPAPSTSPNRSASTSPNPSESQDDIVVATRETDRASPSAPMVAGSDAAERDGTPADQALATRTASVPSGSDSRSVVGPAARPAVGSTTRSIYRAASSRTDALPGADFRVAGTAPAEAGRPDSDRDGVPEARPPILVRKVDPVYPSELDDAGIGGTALLRIRVGADGLPKQVEVTRSSGHEALDQEAVAAVARFLWQPGVGATGPRDFWVDLGITFRPGT